MQQGSLTTIPPGADVDRTSGPEAVKCRVQYSIRISGKLNTRLSTVDQSIFRTNYPLDMTIAIIVATPPLLKTVGHEITGFKRNPKVN